MIVLFITFFYGMYLVYRGTIADWTSFNLFPTEDIIVGIVVMVVSVLLAGMLMGLL